MHTAVWIFASKKYKFTVIPVMNFSPFMQNLLLLLGFIRKHALLAFYILKLTKNSCKEFKVTISIVILVSKSLWFKKPLTLWLSCCKIVSLTSKPMVLQLWNLIGIYIHCMAIYFLGFCKNDIWIFLLVFSFALIGVILIGLKITIIIVIIIIRFF